MTKLLQIISRLLLVIAIQVSAMQIVTAAQANTPTTNKSAPYEFNFGLVLHNSIGEPVGFKKTDLIPISNAGKTSLYGLVVTGLTEEQFTLSSVHILPKKSAPDSQQKIMGKAMLIEKRGAIFMRTDYDDLAGSYQMEIYIDNKLIKTIDYQLVNYEIAARNALTK